MKNKEEKLTVTISKNPGYDKQKLRTEGLDIDRVIKFNKGEKIQVTQDELNILGLHRWLIIHPEEIKEGENNEQ
jgi:hypothetical protein